MIKGKTRDFIAPEVYAQTIVCFEIPHKLFFTNLDIFKYYSKHFQILKLLLAYFLTISVYVLILKKKSAY